MYTPPFTVTAKAVNLIAEISAQIERYAIRMEQADALHLRKTNRIRTIHSSLAIEGNNLTEGQVQDIINGKTVIAPPRDIQEVKNAINVYNMYGKLNPFSVKDLLKAHGTMMAALLDDAGKFRRSGVGVFNGDVCIHMAPPAERVPQLMDDLFEWLATSTDHILIRSCVFHYEFEFIHPFIDGNGRTGRLWQSLILGRLSPVFEYLPVENMVYSNQQGYYDAIGKSSDKVDCAPFIEFMLGEILNALKEHQGEEIGNVGINVGVNVGINKALNADDKEGIIKNLINQSPRISAKDIAQLIGVTQRQCERILAAMKRNGTIRRVGANKNGHWEVTGK